MMNLVLLAWGRSPNKDGNTFKRAEQFFVETTEHHSIMPDVVTYNALLAALNGVSIAKPRDAAMRGEEYLQQLDDLSSRGVEQTCRPNTVTYNQAISLWSNVKTNDPAIEEAVARAQALLDDMIRRFKAGERDLRPNEQTWKAFSSVLNNCGLSEKAKKERLSSLSSFTYS